jgi:type IV secretory pathway TraG/TraD family ATPase VirD4
MMIQSIAQLQKFYSPVGSRIILDNCTYQLFLGSNDLESLRYYAEKIGYMRTIQKGYSENYNQSTGMMQGNGLQENENMELIYQPSGLSHLGDELILITPEGFCKLSKNPLYPN